MLTEIFAGMSGAAVGFFLGLLGGGGSILAFPLLLYVVGVDDVHFSIGTSAVAAGGFFAQMAGTDWRQKRSSEQVFRSFYFCNRYVYGGSVVCRALMT
jgi:uncharacterized membrane protein YfcA